ncbi:class I poly(R)-hydroxyalkanoic acid synthase [Simiduia curdlanivorans]|uniref:Class I poly(R)-hydroxyalkanoic acid synthase n=1 Tax=Simiduia curdlanivorans TaxID=1492769 RepID=A0ABV8V4M4_9GAMM|nr:class I poly(R)-hydroxyalkanoic acid synthase [Simiduia curdlanivorans]MDN3638286.1 class I poly(R)-hydroxyalkanoic acid synthase [Simiduia curdlanivorans]
MTVDYASMVSRLTQQVALHMQDNAQHLSRMVEHGGVKVSVEPSQLMQLQCDLFSRQTQLCNAMITALTEHKPLPEITQATDDPRFTDDAWHEQPAYSFLRQNYLLNAQMLEKQLDALQFGSAADAAHWRFYTRQLINAIAPSNFPWSNPDVMRDAVQEQGESLQRGFNNLLADLQRSPLETLKVNQVDGRGFTLGENIACTPGKVVFRNQLFELLQYAPQSDTVYKTPLLLIPPFINKFYILDLNQKKSLVNWLVGQGFSVFMVSWVNPGEQHRKLGFTDYLRDGAACAIDLVRNLCGVKKIHAAGYCVGGTLLASTQAWLKAQGQDKLASLTLLTTLLDFSEPGDLGHYLYPPLLESLEPMIEARGLLDGRVLATSFNFLRENDLYWPNFINNYLKGKTPPAFDLLVWNSDSTHLTEQIFQTYVKGFYHHNPLAGGTPLTVDGVALNLAAIDTPAYCLGAEKDHIVLWQAAFNSARLLAGATRFVQAGSGHIAGVINPPSQDKYGFRAGALASSLPEWEAGAEAQPGSWWQDWRTWLLAQDSRECPARTPGTAQYPALAEAPGDYVRVTV